MKNVTRNIYLRVVCCGLFFVLAGCGSQVSFEPVDLKGHVRVEKEGQGYCFKVPTDWEIRAQLEDTDVVCLAPVQDGFRDSIIGRTLTEAQLSDPQKLFTEELKALGNTVTIVESWSGPEKPMALTLENAEFSSQPLGQLLYVHQRKTGGGVLIACTTKKDSLEKHREFFDRIVEKAKYELEFCEGPGGLPKVFPTPEVTLSPAP